MFKNNKNLLVIALIIVVNALGYAIVIPILYSYGQRFGLSDFQQGLLFALFSICQFFSTPIIGRLSDKYGRKPLLIISLLGTALSFIMMAFAPSAIFVFLARALDGLTAGNFPVAMAVISDSTDPKDRAKGFGIVTAAFNFGFVFGPAIAALTVGVNGSLPFIIASVITLVAIAMTFFILPETNKHMGQASKGPLFNFKHMAKALFDEKVGRILSITLLYTLAFGLFIYSYQPFATKILHLTPEFISIDFTLFGIIGFAAQIFLISRFTKFFGERKLLIYSLFAVAGSFALLFVSFHLALFLISTAILSLANCFVQPLSQAILSREVDPSQQGGILGIATSYSSLGFIFGPILGGILTTLSIPTPFIVGAVLVVICGYVATFIPKHLEAKEKVV